jgi:hypothetical protein
MHLTVQYEGELLDSLKYSCSMARFVASVSSKVCYTTYEYIYKDPQSVKLTILVSLRSQ